jgi:hypothetical protein
VSPPLNFFRYLRSVSACGNRFGRWLQNTFLAVELSFPHGCPADLRLYFIALSFPRTSFAHFLPQKFLLWEIYRIIKKKPKASANIKVTTKCKKGSYSIPLHKNICYTHTHTVLSRAGGIKVSSTGNPTQGSHYSTSRLLLLFFNMDDLPDKGTKYLMSSNISEYLLK